VKSYRTDRIGELMRREVSDLLLRGLKDARVRAGMVSVTGVEVTKDLRLATIYVSIYGDEAAQAETMIGLNSAQGFIRGELGRRIRLRHTPEITFEHDRSLERGDKIMALLLQLKKPDPALTPPVAEEEP